MKRTASAVWTGTGKEGKGHVTTASNVLNKTQYSYKSRFEEGVGTNPGELVAAAHSGCFAMKLSFILGDAGFTPQELAVTCTVTFADGAISNSHLVLKAKVPGIANDKFQACANDAKANCPISKSLNTKITMDASLA